MTNNPFPWFKPLRVWWPIALAVGICALAAGIFALTAGPRCGHDNMKQGDICVDERYVTQRATTYDQERRPWYFITPLGGILTIAGAAGVALNKMGNKRRQREWQAGQSQGV